jgi:hypothetical protein
MRALGRVCRSGAALAAAVASPVAGADKVDALYQGTLAVAPAFAEYIGPDDRLILRVFHPGPDGLEMDTTYQIVKTFELPMTFGVGPSVMMSGTTKHTSYVVEAFTDKDGDVLGVAEGELIVRTEGPLPLGTKGLQLEFATLR